MNPTILLDKNDKAEPYARARALAAPLILLGLRVGLCGTRLEDSGRPFQGYFHRRRAVSRRIDDAVVTKWVKLRNAGWTFKAIAEKYDVDRETVSRRIDEFRVSKAVKNVQPFKQMTAAWPSLRKMLDAKTQLAELAGLSGDEFKALLDLRPQLACLHEENRLLAEQVEELKQGLRSREEATAGLALGAKAGEKSPTDLLSSSNRSTTRQQAFKLDEPMRAQPSHSAKSAQKLPARRKPS
jgi:hypothetical protein